VKPTCPSRHCHTSAHVTIGKAEPFSVISQPLTS
jgi:hypothetical protein